MIQVKHVTKKTTTPRSNNEHTADAVSRALLGRTCIRFMNGELIDIYEDGRANITLKVEYNSKILINNRGYHDNGTIWRVTNVMRRYLRTGYYEKLIFLTKTKKVWRQ